MRKVFYGTCALLFFILAIIGIVLPLVPATPFVILSLFCLHRVNPELVRRVMKLRLFQKYIPKRIMNKLT